MHSAASRMFALIAFIKKHEFWFRRCITTALSKPSGNTVELLCEPFSCNVFESFPCNIETHYIYYVVD